MCGSGNGCPGGTTLSSSASTISLASPETISPLAATMGVSPMDSQPSSSHKGHISSVHGKEGLIGPTRGDNSMLLACEHSGYSSSDHWAVGS